MVNDDRRLRFFIGLLPLVVMILDGLDGTGEMKILFVITPSSSEYDPESSPRLLHSLSFDDDDDDDDDDDVSIKRFLDALSYVYDGE
jgi:hypothetical protein